LKSRNLNSTSLIYSRKNRGSRNRGVLGKPLNLLYFLRVANKIDHEVKQGFQFEKNNNLES